MANHKESVWHFTKAFEKPRIFSFSNIPTISFRPLFNFQTLQLSAVGLSSLYMCKNLILHANCDPCRVVEQAVKEYETGSQCFDWEGFINLILPDGLSILGAIVVSIFSLLILLS